MVEQNAKQTVRRKTINQCYNAIRQIDSESAVTKCFIRRLCKEKKVDYILNGNKSLVNYTELINYLGYSEA